LISGFAEVVLGIALDSSIIKPCRLGIIALIIAVFLLISITKMIKQE
jgi:uncharacterized membrane protein